MFFLIFIVCFSFSIVRVLINFYYLRAVKTEGYETQSNQKYCCCGMQKESRCRFCPCLLHK